MFRNLPVPFLFLVVFAAPVFSQPYFSPNPAVAVFPEKIQPFLKPIIEIEPKATFYNLSKPVLQTILVLQSNAGSAVSDGQFNFGRVLTGDQLKRFSAFSTVKNGFVVCDTRSRGVEAVALCLHFLRANGKNALTDAQWLTLVFGPGSDLNGKAEEADEIYRLLTGRGFADLGLGFGSRLEPAYSKLSESNPTLPKPTQDAPKRVEVTPPANETPKPVAESPKPSATKVEPVKSTEGIPTIAAIETPKSSGGLPSAAAKETPKSNGASSKTEAATPKATEEKPKLSARLTETHVQNPTVTAPPAPVQAPQKETAAAPQKEATGPTVALPATAQAIDNTNKNPKPDPVKQVEAPIVQGTKKLTNVQERIIIQSKENASEEPETYARSSFKILETYPYDPSRPFFLRATRSNYPFSKRFDWNYSPTQVFQLDTGQYHSNKFVATALNRTGLGRELLAYWYGRGPDGGFDANLTLIKRRGVYNASDMDVKMAQSGARGFEELRDAGVDLIKNTFVVLIELESFQTMEQYYDEIDARNREAASKNKDLKFEPTPRLERGFRGNVAAHLLKMDFNDTLKQLLYDIWIYPEDSETEKAAKVKAFDQLQVPLVYIKKLEGSLWPIETKVKKKDPLIPQTDEELMTAFEVKAMEKLFEKIGKQSQIRVKASLFNAAPIQVKIGRKEGVYPEKRFFVYEKTEKPDGSLVYRRKAVLRAKSRVVDNAVNANGETQPTMFSRVGGVGKLDRGMLVREKSELGWSIAALKAPGIGNKVRDAGANVEWNASLFLGKRFAGRVPTGFKLGASYTVENLVPNTEDHSSNVSENFTNISAYLKKDWPIAGVLRLGVYAGITSKTYQKEEEDEIVSDSSAIFIPLAVDFGTNLTPWLHLFIQGEISIPPGKGAQNWNDYLDDKKRKGFTSRLGLRVSF